MTERTTYPFVAELARNEGLVDKLLATHLADERGKCAGCHPDDKQRQPWPCSVWHFADQARLLRENANMQRAG